MVSLGPGVVLVWNPFALTELTFNPFLRAEIMDDAQRVVEGARADAPKRTGAGAASIRAEYADAIGIAEVRISWDRDHYYLRFHELGSRYLPARPFLVPALDRYL